MVELRRIVESRAANWRRRLRTQRTERPQVVPIEAQNIEIINVLTTTVNELHKDGDTTAAFIEPMPIPLEEGPVVMRRGIQWGENSSRAQALWLTPQTTGEPLLIFTAQSKNPDTLATKSFWAYANEGNLEDTPVGFFVAPQDLSRLPLHEKIAIVLDVAAQGPVKWKTMPGVSATSS